MTAGLVMLHFALLLVMALTNRGATRDRWDRKDRGDRGDRRFRGQSVAAVQKSPTENGWVPDAPLIPL